MMQNKIARNAPLSSQCALLGTLWASALSLGFALGGCGMIIGVEDRKLEEVKNDPNHVVDEKTDLDTSPLCIEYCDEVMDNCIDGGKSGERTDNRVYLSRTSCINTCNALPEGDAAEPADNTVQCRLVHAKSARSVPDEECVPAGPGGGKSCGSNCDAWCLLLEEECPDDAETLKSCMDACETIPESPGFNVDTVEGSYLKDDIQCRLIHLGAVGGDPESVHCGHSRYVAEDKCVPKSEDELSCARYCDTIMGNCRGENAAYESQDNCMATCKALPMGKLADTSANTVGCRLYHSKSSALAPENHCNHAGPTGDGHCGAMESEEGNTGTCESYCRLWQTGCATDFSAEYSNLEGCIEDCGETFRKSGAADDTFYSVETAREEKDSLQCRVYSAVAAVSGDEDACKNASLKGDCK